MCCMQRKKNIRDDLYNAFTGAKREKRNTCTVATNHHHDDSIGISVSNKWSTSVQTGKYKIPGATGGQQSC